MVLFIFYYLFL